MKIGITGASGFTGKRLSSELQEKGYEVFKFVRREPKIENEIYDDHVPLWEVAQIPAIDIIDFQYPNMFYNYWHTQYDTPENCSPQSLGQVGTLLVNYIYGSIHE